MIDYHDEGRRLIAAERVERMAADYRHGGRCARRRAENAPAAPVRGPAPLSQEINAWEVTERWVIGHSG